MTVLVRPAGPQDCERLVAIDPHAASGGARAVDIRAWIGAGVVHVAEADGAVVGYVVLTRGFFRQPFVELLFVETAARRGGAGAALLAHCASLTPPGEKLWISTNESNLPMQRLLGRTGFVPSGRVENLDPGDPELFYVRLPSVTASA